MKHKNRKRRAKRIDVTDWISPLSRERLQNAARITGEMEDDLLDMAVAAFVANHGIKKEESPPNLVPEERAAATYFSKRFYQTKGKPTEEDLDDARRIVLRVAFAHPVEVSEWINRIIDYRKAEFPEGSWRDQKILKARIGSRPEYRKLMKETAR